jgi:hypothetical protein
MPHEHPWQRHQRERWTRPDAHLWVRPDSARFYKPGTDLAEIFPEVARQREEEDAAEQAAIARELEALAALRDELMEIKAELARRRLEDEAKYSPSQPRVAAGNPRGGQWTDRSGGQSTVAGPSQDADQSQNADLTRPMGNVDLGAVSESSELGDLFQIKPNDTRVDGVRLAGDDRPLEINPNELVNRHILEEHVGKTDEELIARIRQSQDTGLFYRSGLYRNGSFDSVESARDFISQTLQGNSQAVQQVASGQQNDLFLTQRFGYRTGKEAYLDLNTFQIGMRPTYEVGVAIMHDDSRSSGYRVVTAYPRNYNPRIGR